MAECQQQRSFTLSMRVNHITLLLKHHTTTRESHCPSDQRREEEEEAASLPTFDINDQTDQLFCLVRESTC